MRYPTSVVAIRYGRGGPLASGASNANGPLCKQGLLLETHTVMIRIMVLTVMIADCDGIFLILNQSCRDANYDLDFEANSNDKAAICTLKTCSILLFKWKQNLKCILQQMGRHCLLLPGKLLSKFFITIWAWPSTAGQVWGAAIKIPQQWRGKFFLVSTNPPILLLLLLAFAFSGQLSPEYPCLGQWMFRSKGKKSVNLKGFQKFFIVSANPPILSFARLLCLSVSILGQSMFRSKVRWASQLS